MYKRQEVERSRFKDDKGAIIDALHEELRDRFCKVLNHPILEAMRVFDHRVWPSDPDTLSEFGEKQLRLLYEECKVYMDGTSFDVVWEQFEEVKEMINTNEGLHTRKYADLWAQMLCKFSPTYSELLRLVAIVLVVPVDTSECERVFSLMNNHKPQDEGAVSAQPGELAQFDDVVQRGEGFATRRRARPR